MMMIVDDFLGTVGVEGLKGGGGVWPLPWDCFAVV